MNTWSNEQYIMPNIMGMQSIMHNIMPTNGITTNTLPLASSVCMLGDINVNNMQNSSQGNAQAANVNTQEIRRSYQKRHIEEQTHDHIMFENNAVDSDRTRDKRPISSDSERTDKFGRNKFALDKNQERRRTKWDTNDKLIPGISMENIITPGNMMPYTNIMGQTMDMASMQNLANMQSMGNIGTISNMANMPAIMPTIMTGMIDQNVMMHQTIPTQPTFLKNAILLPPNAGVSMPPQRQKPPGCQTIFVGGLPSGVSEEIIREIFNRFGAIVDIKWHKQGVCHVRFDRMECVEPSFMISGFRFKYYNQLDSDATTIFIDYALNRDDQTEYERNKRKREVTPPRVEQFSTTALSAITDRIKSDVEFMDAAPTLVSWLERGECNKRNSNAFYSVIQTTNNQIRRLFNDKMQIEEEYQAMKAKTKEKFYHVLTQFEQIAKILSAAKHQRVSDHFTKQQRRNIDMWLKMTEELENLREEFNCNFAEEECERIGKTMSSKEKYERLKTENENLAHELEGYKNEVHLAKSEAETKFEKFKAHFIAQHALLNKQDPAFASLTTPPLVNKAIVASGSSVMKMESSLSSADNKFKTSRQPIPFSEAKLISLLTAFLMVHPLGATSDYLVSYIKSMMPDVSQTTVTDVLQTYKDVFVRKTNGVGANIEHRWHFITFESIKCVTSSLITID